MTQTDDTPAVTGAAQPVWPGHRFDWWQALVRVLSSIEALREGRALYVLLATFCCAGLAAASAQASVGRDELGWAIAQGAGALFLAFYGVNAAGLIMMDRALGHTPREVADAVLDALGMAHRVLVVLVAMLLGAALLAATLGGLYWLSGPTQLGPWLFAVVAPATVVVIGWMLLAGAAVLAPLTAPTVWSGLGALAALRRVWALMRTRLLQAVVLNAALSVATGLVAAATSLIVMLGGRVMAEASVWIMGVDVPPEALMAGLFGRGVWVNNPSAVPAESLQYIGSATIGGGVVFAIALVLPTLVYLRGVCEIHLALQASSQPGAGHAPSPAGAPA